MRTRAIRSCVVALVITAAAARASAAEAKKNASSNEPLVVGDGYTIRVERQGVSQRFSGDLVKLNDRWIVLHCASKRRHDTSLFSKIPFLGHKQRGASVGRIDELLWIPLEASVVEKRTPATTHTNPQPVAGDAPPAHRGCTVQMAVGGKLLRAEGGLEVVRDDELTIAAPRKVKKEQTPVTPASLASLASTSGIKGYETRYVRRHLPRNDILCIRVPDFDSSTISQ
jgi:hypothetical protein